MPATARPTPPHSITGIMVPHNYDPLPDGTNIYTLTRGHLRSRAQRTSMAGCVWRLRYVEYRCPTATCAHHLFPIWQEAGWRKWRSPYCPACQDRVNNVRYVSLVQTGRYRLDWVPRVREVGYLGTCRCSGRPGLKLRPGQTLLTVWRKPRRRHLPCSQCGQVPAGNVVRYKEPSWMAEGTAEGPFAMVLA